MRKIDLQSFFRSETKVVLTTLVKQVKNMEINFSVFQKFGVSRFCMLLHVTAGHCMSLHDTPKMWNIMQKWDPFLHVIAGYCRSLQWLQDIPKMWNIMQKWLFLHVIGISCKNRAHFCILLQVTQKYGISCKKPKRDPLLHVNWNTYLAKTGPIFACYCRLLHYNIRYRVAGCKCPILEGYCGYF